MNGGGFCLLHHWGDSWPKNRWLLPNAPSSFLVVSFILFLQSQHSWEKFIVSTFSNHCSAVFSPHYPTTFAKCFPWLIQWMSAVCPIFLEIAGHISLPWSPWHPASPAPLIPFYCSSGFSSASPFNAAVPQGSVLDLYYLHPTYSPQVISLSPWLKILTHWW